MLPARVWGDNDPTSLAIFDPRQINLAEVSLGPTGLLQPDLDSIIFLGRIYPTSVLDTGPYHPIPSTDSLRRGLDQPAPDKLLSLLGQGELAFRPLYIYLHQELEEWRDAGWLTPQLSTALLAEYVQYRRLDLMWLRRRVYRRLDNEKPTGHMRFQGHQAMRKRRPDVSWHGHIDVPVHRLLWPYINRLQPLRPEDRLRKRDICPDEVYRDCVNPAHFEIAVPMSDRRLIAPGFQNTQRSRYSGYMVRWNDGPDYVWEDTHPSTGRVMRLVHCGLEHRHLMPEGVQRHYQQESDPDSPWYRPHIQRRSKCVQCWQQYQNERGRNPDGSLKRHPRGAQVHNAQAEDQAARDFMREAWLDAERNGRVEYEPDDGVRRDIFGVPIDPD
jgi:hypothetical protein